jgi:hypothetical protein
MDLTILIVRNQKTPNCDALSDDGHAFPVQIGDTPAKDCFIIKLVQQGLKESRLSTHHPCGVRVDPPRQDSLPVLWGELAQGEEVGEELFALLQRKGQRLCRGYIVETSGGPEFEIIVHHLCELASRATVPTARSLPVAAVRSLLVAVVTAPGPRPHVHTERFLGVARAPVKGTLESNDFAVAGALPQQPFVVL